MKDRAPLVFEIGCEEIPAGLLAKTTAELKAILERHLEANRLLVAPVVTFAAPRRLGAISNAVLLTQTDEKKEVL